jgi:hypothetical protein
MVKEMSGHASGKPRNEPDAHYLRFYESHRYYGARWLSRTLAPSKFIAKSTLMMHTDMYN